MTRLPLAAPAGPGAGVVGPPRVLHVSQPTDAGVARVVLSLVEHQVGAGLAVSVACPSTGPLADRAARAGATVLAWEAVREPAQGLVSESAALARILRDVSPDVVHLHSAKAGLVGRLTVRGTLPTVFQPHAWADQAVRGPVRVAARAWERTGRRWTDLTVCNSDAEARHGAGLGVRDAVVVRNGVDPAEFAPRDRAAARARVGLPAGARVAVCVGRLCEQKGQDGLLELWRALVDDGPSAGGRSPGGQSPVGSPAHGSVAAPVLVLVGSGPAEDRLRLAAAGLPVRFVTDCDDPRDWYAAADLVVAPSRWEGAALAPLEAMAMARAVVGYDVGGLGAVLPTPGAAVPPGDVAALARAVRERLAVAVVDPDAEGLTNHARVEQAYDSRATTSTITALAVALATGRDAGGVVPQQRRRTADYPEGIR